MEEDLEGSFFTLSGLQASHPSHSHPLLCHSQRRVSLYLPISTSINLHLPSFSPQDPPLLHCLSPSCPPCSSGRCTFRAEGQRNRLRGETGQKRAAVRNLNELGNIQRHMLLIYPRFFILFYSQLLETPSITLYFQGYLSVSIIRCKWSTLQFQFIKVEPR